MSNVNLVSVVEYAQKVAERPGVRCAQVDGRDGMIVNVFLDNREIISLDVEEAIASGYFVLWPQKYNLALDLCLGV